MAGASVDYEKIDGWDHVYSGKVRDMYVPDGTTVETTDRFLMVASDRISAYDYILPTVIPMKGVVLTQMTLWWFEQLADVVDNHLISTDVPGCVAGRAMITKKLDMFPVECVVRGYLTGSGKAEYDAHGQVCGISLPVGLREASRLENPIFTPAAKAEVGEHDENISFDVMSQRIGLSYAEKLRELSIKVYERARDIALDKGIIVADTKFEFGLDASSQEPHIILGDEILTPDSSRFWPADVYEEGKVQPSFDKQFIRDWLTSDASGWDRKSGDEPPQIPDDIVKKTSQRYLQAYEILTGHSL
ncbi:MAG: phosphoribosylaminoimidazolesuccinocarboxamide synthase [Actinomycetaceae bacterium]|nr:phosphoribosylaminoimidazolesuccinocarboxamide synthase [Actinomycetaceae bacterium]